MCINSGLALTPLFVDVMAHKCILQSKHFGLLVKRNRHHQSCVSCSDLWYKIMLLWLCNAKSPRLSWLEPLIIGWWSVMTVMITPFRVFKHLASIRWKSFRQIYKYGLPLAFSYYFQLGLLLISFRIFGIFFCLKSLKARNMFKWDISAPQRCCIFQQPRDHKPHRLTQKWCDIKYIYI